MEVYVFFSLLGIGYIMSKSNKNESPKLNRYKTGEHLNPYDTNIIETVRHTEKAKAKEKYERSVRPNSKVISTNYRDIQTNQKQDEVDSLLSGQRIRTDEFTHNNMEPFFGGTIKQNMDISAGHRNLEMHTGMNNEINIDKQEQVCFADVAKDSGSSPHTNLNSYTEQYERMFNGDKRTNELPFEQLRVAPGLNDGYGHKPAQRGFDTGDRDYVREKTIDELRQGSNPQQSYTARPTMGLKGTKRGFAGKMAKNKVDTFHEVNPNTFMKNRSIYTKDKHRSEIIVKETNRKCGMAYSGNIYKNIGNEQSAKLQSTKKNILEKFGTRNAGQTGVGKPEHDYGKKNILVYSNERDLTGVKTYEGNLTTLIKSFVAPLQDVLKPTTKEYNVMNNREFGQLQKAIPNKQTMYDPNDVAKTTIKETFIHDTRTGNIVGEKQSVVYDPDDVARATVKETLPYYENINNMRSKVTKATVYDPDDVTKTTMKETTELNEHDGHIGNVEGGGGYETNQFDAPNTSKQFLSDKEHMGTGPTRDSGKGYLTNEMDAPLTNKQFSSDNDYYGGARSADPKQTSYDDVYNATINDMKETLLKNRKPTQNNAKVAIGGEGMNVDLRADSCEYQMNNTLQRVNERSLDATSLNLTTEKVNLEQQIDDRLAPNILKAFHDNPFTKSLTDAA